MAVLQARSREQIRVAVGHNLGGVKLIEADATGTTTTFLTDDLFGGAADHKGKWLQGTGPTSNDGSTFRVVDSSVTSYRTTLTFHPAGTSTADGDTAELWEERFDPARIHEFINQALIEVTGLAYDPEESLALHGDGRQRRYDIPSQFAMLTNVYMRESMESTQIHDAATEWDEASAPTNVTRSVDTKDYKRPSGSNRFVIAGAFTTGLVSSKAISSLDLSGYDYVEFWVKSTIATTAGDFTLLLDNTALCASALETLSIPALVADTWTYVRVALANPELDTAIISVGLNAAANIAANTIWVNDVKAVLDSTASWERMDRNNWRVDEQARDLVLYYAPGYYLLKLTGGDKPLLLTADSDVCEVDDEFVIARATELTLLSAGGGPGTDPDALRSLAGYWANRADIAKRSLPWQFGNRVVS